MDLQSRKILFVQEFLKLQDEEVVVHLEDVLHQKKQDTNENKAKVNKAVSKDLDIWAAIKPVKNSYSIDEMIKTTSLLKKMPSTKKPQNWMLLSL